jgi:hypothetical protein
MGRAPLSITTESASGQYYVRPIVFHSSDAKRGELNSPVLLSLF